MKVANVLTQTQITAACRGALAAGAKQVTVEAILPNGTKLKVTAHADDQLDGRAPSDTSNPWDEVLSNAALEKRPS